MLTVQAEAGYMSQTSIKVTEDIGRNYFNRLNQRVKIMTEQRLCTMVDEGVDVFLLATEKI